MADPRRRNTRHLLTPDLLSSTILVTNLPQSWNQDTITSIVAGSGPITSVSSRTDPRNGKLTGITIDYSTSKDCKRALEILQRIKKFPCNLERIIPNNYNKAKETKKLEFNRDSYPWDAGLELPFELVSEVPLPRRPLSTTTSAATAATTNATNNSTVTFPDILRKASKHLPQLQPNSLTTNDAISKNLSKIPPLQLLEMISNLKILANQDAKKLQLESFLKTNNDISVAVTQAMLEMGFINYNVVTKILSEQQQTNSLPISTSTTKVFSPQINNNQQLYSSNKSVGNNGNNGASIDAGVGNISTRNGSNSNSTSANNTPRNNSATPISFVPQPQPQFVPQFGFPPSIPGMSPPVPNMPPAIPNMSPPIPVMPPFMPPTVPGIPAMPMNNGAMAINNSGVGSGVINIAKLNSLPQQQQDMIKQVLQLTDEQVRLLPLEQKSMVENLKREYIL